MITPNTLACVMIDRVINSKTEKIYGNSALVVGTPSGLGCAVASKIFRLELIQVPVAFGALTTAGNQAYRERKRSDANPYKNDQKKKGWNEGWEDARKFCTTGQLPSIGLLDAHRKLCVKDPVKYAAACKDAEENDGELPQKWLKGE